MISEELTVDLMISGRSMVAVEMEEDADTQF